MKKIFSLLLLFTFVASLAACNGSTDNEDPNNNEDPNTEDPNGEDPQDEEPTVIKFASWGVGTEEENNLLRRRVSSFNEANDDIQIEIMDYEGNYREFLSTQAAAGDFPDVLAVENVPEFVINEWIGDISDLVAVDTEWDDVPEALSSEITYGDYVYAVPEAYHYLGYYANIDLIENSGSNADFMNFDYSLDEFTTAIRDMRDTSGVTDGSGTIGITNPFEFVNFVPSIYDETDEISHFVWEGNGFNFASEYLSDALALSADLFTNDYTFESFSAAQGGDADNPTPSEREERFGTNDAYQAFFNSKIGFLWDASWGASSIENNIDDLFYYDFVGLPDSRVIGVSDYLGISASTDNREEAYEVAKYLTFGSEGLNDAFDIIDEAETSLAMNGLPINESTDITERWFETYPQSGFKRAYEKAANGELEVLIEGNKTVPGFIDARFTYDTGIDAQVSRPDASDGATLSIGDLIWDAGQGAVVLSDYLDNDLAANINNRFEEIQAEFENAQE